MKLPFRPIAILVIISLLGIFIYQAYWITGLYKTMKHELEQSIVEAMRMSDYNEMMLRVKEMQKENKAHGSVEVSAGYNSDSGKSFVRSSTTVNQTDSAGSRSLLKEGIPMKYDSVSVSYPNDSTRDILFTRGQEGTNISVWAERDSVKEVLEDTVINEDEPQASLRAEGGIDMMLRDQSSMVELATFIQRGMHSGLDIFIEPDIAVYDSLLNTYLQERGLKLPYRLERLHSGADPDSTLVYTDTLAIVGTPGYIPSEKAKQYNYAFDIHSNQSYRLTIEPIYKIVLRQMSGILTTSFVILIILGFSFWFLIRTILRQKTLEEMKSDFTNRTHFSNILSNLIDNAIKYSPDKADIMICCRKKETEQVEISVTDHGIGIPTDKQPHIFDKFYRVPTGNIHNTKGYGLGLFYVKTMVEKHGGIVTVRSEAGKGSTFTIRI